MARRISKTSFRGLFAIALPVALGTLLSGCASSSSDTESLLTPASGGQEATGSLSNLGATPGANAAREYWANALARNPRDDKAAIAYAKSLKAEGSKDKAMSVLQHAAMYNPDSTAVASEEGRLALDMGQTGLAEKLLNRANSDEQPDWRVLNALGTLEAQRGNKPSAKAYFERAARIAPNEPSVLNNLALTYALDGDPAKAEAMLRRAAAAGGDQTKVRQNLALVLGVQGKYDEAQQLATTGLDKSNSDANRAYLQKMVTATPVILGKQAEMSPKKRTAAPVIDVPQQAWSTDVSPVAGSSNAAGTTPVLADAGALPWAKNTKATGQK